MEGTRGGRTLDLMTMQIISKLERDPFVEEFSMSLGPFFILNRL